MTAGNGDAGRARREAAEAMFARHVDKARAIAKRWAFVIRREDEREDLISEAYVGLWKACLSYEASRGTTEWTWAYEHVQGAVNHFDRIWVVRLPKWIPPDERWEAASKFIAGADQDPWTGRQHNPENSEQSPDENGPAEIDPGIERAEVLASLPILDGHERALVAMALAGAHRTDLAAADRGALVRLMGKLSDTQARREAAARAAENMYAKMSPNMRAAAMRRRRRGGRGLRCVCCSDARIDWAIAAGATYKEAGARFKISPAAISRHRARHARKPGAAGVAEAVQ